LIPPIENLNLRDWHRLVPTEFRPKDVFREVATGNQIRDADILASATGISQRQNSSGIAGISHRELIYGVPNAEIVRNAFRYAGKGGRFHSAIRGAWYAADHEQVSIQEVGYHLIQRLKTAKGIQGNKAKFHYDDWQADFHADFYRLNSTKKYAMYLQPEPVPQCYEAGQELARNLLLKGGNGIVYPSVRFGEGGICVACFRPALVYRPRLSDTYTLTITLESSGAYEVRHARK
jgi:RES domain